jgi:hypothetical protein
MLRVRRASMGVEFSPPLRSAAGGALASPRFLPNPKQILDGGTVGRASADMMNPHDPIRIDEHVTALLLGIALRPAWQLSSKQFTEICPPHRRPDEISELGPPHAVGMVELPALVDEQGPGKAGLVCINSGHTIGLEGDNDNGNRQGVQCRLRASHLHEVPSTRQSSEVPMENDQQPTAPVILESTDMASGIGQSERNRRPANEVEHTDL